MTNRPFEKIYVHSDASAAKNGWVGECGWAYIISKDPEENVIMADSGIVIGGNHNAEKVAVEYALQQACKLANRVIIHCDMRLSIKKLDKRGNELGIFIEHIIDSEAYLHHACHMQSRFEIGKAAKARYLKTAKGRRKNQRIKERLSVLFKEKNFDEWNQSWKYMKSKILENTTNV